MLFTIYRAHSIPFTLVSHRLSMKYCRYCGKFDCPIQILFFVLFVSVIYLIMLNWKKFRDKNVKSLFLDCLHVFHFVFFCLSLTLFSSFLSSFHHVAIDIYRIMLRYVFYDDTSFFLFICKNLRNIMIILFVFLFVFFFVVFAPLKKIESCLATKNTDYRWI